MSMPSNPAFAQATDIEQTLALLAERCADPTPAVYDRMFAAHPYMKPYFWRDTNGAIKGEMLARTFDAILDFIGPRTYAHHMIGTEMITHEGYDVPREIFVTFFETIRDTVCDLLGEAWSAQHEDAWSNLLKEIHEFADAVPRSDIDIAHNREVRDKLIAGGWNQAGPKQG